MPGYPRPAPAFRWYSWWEPMGLIDSERDDDALLEAEDEAIRSAERGDAQPDGTFELPDSLAHLVNQDDGPLHEGTQGEGGRTR